MTLELRPEPTSALAARRWVADGLAHWGRPGVVELVVLLTSEIVTNAVVHGGPHADGEMLHLAMEQTDEVVRIEVGDGSGTLPIVGDGALDMVSGRGLMLLDALSSRWGATPTGTGKAVWFEVSA